MKRALTLGLACFALSACGGGGASTPNVPATNAAGQNGGSGTQSTAGKAAVTVSIVIPAKGAGTTAAARRSPQYISANTTQLTATFTPQGTGSPATGQAPCAGPGTCTLQVYVVPGTYSILLQAGDGNGILSAGLSTSNATVALGVANTAPAITLTQVLHAIVVTGLSPSTVYNGQTDSGSITVTFQDADGNGLTGAMVDDNANPVTGITATPNDSANTGNFTLNGGTSPVAITTSGQTVPFNYTGTDPLNPTTLSVTTASASGSVDSYGTQTGNVLSPFDVALTTPAAFNGSNPGNPLFTATDNTGNANLEFPALGTTATTLTVTDNDTAADTPLTVDPDYGSCYSNGQIGSITINGTPYSGTPVNVAAYSGPFQVQFTTTATSAGQCYVAVSDNSGDFYYVNLFFDQNSVYVTHKKRTK